MIWPDWTPVPVRRVGPSDPIVFPFVTRAANYAPCCGRACKSRTMFEPRPLDLQDGSTDSVDFKAAQGCGETLGRRKQGSQTTSRGPPRDDAVELSRPNIT
jgi:hypothetical protein